MFALWTEHDKQKSKEINRAGTTFTANQWALEFPMSDVIAERTVLHCTMATTCRIFVNSVLCSSLPQDPNCNGKRAVRSCLAVVLMTLC